MPYDRCIYRLPAPTQETYWEDTWANSNWDQLVQSQPRKDWWNQLAALPERLEPGELILEAGCGAAPVVYLMHQRGYRAKGVDTAQETIARVKELHPELDLEVQNVERLNIPDGAVGLYISLGVVEHDPDGPDDILAEAARVTRDDGLAFITVPYLNVYRRIREPWWRLKYFLHRAIAQPLFKQPEMKFYQYAFARSTILEKIRRAGFEIEEVRYCHTPVAIRKDLGESLLLRLALDVLLRRQPGVKNDAHRKGRLDPRRVRALSEAFDKVSPKLMSHVLAVTARRVPRGTRA
jgi:SAM-dependent methyltransferase